MLPKDSVSSLVSFLHLAVALTQKFSFVRWLGPQSRRPPKRSRCTLLKRARCVSCRVRLCVGQHRSPVSSQHRKEVTRNKRNSRLGQGLHQICGRMEVIRFGKFVIDQHWIAHTRSRPYIRFAFKKRYHPSSDVFLISQLGISSNAAPSKMHPCCQPELR
jgi:hypothetical protein